MKKIIFPLLLSFAMLLTVAIYTNAQDALAENVIRLHVIANSDTEEDQAVKLFVRDAILNAFSDCSISSCKQNAEAKIKSNLQLAEAIANRVLAENGFSYSARAEYGAFDFPTRTYGDVTLPAGKYSGLRIHLGESAGRNWWCVMYPPLCFNDANVTYNKNETENVTFQFKFKWLEILKSI